MDTARIAASTLRLLFAVVVGVGAIALSLSQSLASANSVSVAASARALARREALLRDAAGLSSSSQLADHATESRNRRKRAALARRGAGIDAVGSSSSVGNLDQLDFSDDDEKLLLLEEEEFQRQLDLDDEEFEKATSSSDTAAVAAVKSATADSSFTSKYGVPPSHDTETGTKATTTPASSSSAVASPHASTTAAATATATSSPPPLDDIVVLINTPHYLGAGYAAPIEGCKRKVKETSSSTSSSASSSSSSSSSEQTIPLRCEFSADASKARQAHALWYHLPNTSPFGPYGDLPPEENDGNPFTIAPATKQVAVAATMESAAYYPNILDPEFMKHFAVESSYRLRSDAMLMYFGEPHVKLWTNLSSIKSFKEKKVRFLVLFFCLLRGLLELCTARRREKKTQNEHTSHKKKSPLATNNTGRHRLRLLQLRRSLRERRDRQEADGDGGGPRGFNFFVYFFVFFHSSSPLGRSPRHSSSSSDCCSGLGGERVRHHQAA